MGFDAQPTLTGDTLTLRPLTGDDHDGLYRAASAPETWAGHPARDRYKPDVFRPYFELLLASRATLAVIDTATGEIIGCSRYYSAPDRPGTISIGFTFLDHRYWGGAVNRAMKGLMLAHAFADFDAVWFHIDPTNIRSQKATMKLGARHAYDAELALGPVPAPWKVYRLDRGDWTP
ncbi:GNAT family N-acetyltransferase [Octadecabacter sp. R77987]|uniref:GNAT family N-acetyltransferase n=1 Tax=Octadecabacter sp. R77987 TaxID=3093874 RepID=UPI00366C1C30